jgi:hypothetical protein
MIPPESSPLSNFRGALMPFIPPVLDGRTFAGRLSHRINFYRYFGTAQKFKPHVDGDWPGYYYDNSEGKIKTWDNMSSMLSMLLYFTDNQSVISQGVTRLYGDTTIIEVSPKKGSALFFDTDLVQILFFIVVSLPGPARKNSCKN